MPAIQHGKGRDGLTKAKMRNTSQDVTARVQLFWPMDSTGGVLAGEQDDLGVDERSGGDALAQGLAERECGRHSVNK